MPRYTANEFERVLAYVREQRAAWAQEICVGKAQSFEDYQRRVGYIKAMDDVEAYMAKVTGTEENHGETDA